MRTGSTRNNFIEEKLKIREVKTSSEESIMLSPREIFDYLVIVSEVIIDPPSLIMLTRYVRMTIFCFAVPRYPTMPALLARVLRSLDQV
jgi:hypothetical protein